VTKKKGVFIFDCDGVILDSNKLKSQAFRMALEGEPQNLVDHFIDYHKKFGGVSRFEKFGHYFTSIHKKENSKELAKEAVARYGALVEKMLLECDLIPGVIAYLDHLQKDYDIYVVSGGAQDELREVFRQRGLDSYFTEIFGSPRSKADILEALNEQGKLANPLLYFGDAELDMKMADRFGFTFVFVYGRSEWLSALQKMKSLEYRSIENFTAIKHDDLYDYSKFSRSNTT